MVPSPLDRGGIYYYNPLYGQAEGSLFVHSSGSVPQDLKRGESCATNIGYIVTTGDASISEAAKKGGVQRILFMDFYAENILLGLYQKYCLIVWGN